MIKSCIIGAGQLGSRHLQGILNYTAPQSIFVIDPSEDSLRVSKERAEQIDHKHSITYLTDANQLPESLDFVIVATNSMHREQAIISLLEKCSVTNLILEKVLFPEVAAYERVAKLIDETNTKVWVNHPRRMYPHYEVLQNKLDKLGTVNFQATGTNWGLGCNGLHIIDVCAFLCGAKGINSIDTSGVNSEISESKRAGYIEFSGTILVHFDNGSTAVISSFEGTPTPLTLHIGTASDKWTIQEAGSPQMIHFDSSNNFESETTEVGMYFQSQLSTNLIQSIMEEGSCNLPNLSEASTFHIAFIQALLQHRNKHTGLNSEILPIT